MKIIKGGITAPKGFLASSVSCGIKESGRDDLALLYSELPALGAGVFTTNRIESESVVVTKRRIKRVTAQAIIVNSGNANCCVGDKGIKDAETITGLTGKYLGIDEDRVLIASTGVIGRPMTVEKIKRKIPRLVRNLSSKNGTRFSRAIMTTDTFNKELAVEFNIGQRKVRLGGAAKGAGMISPEMATMLAFFTTDAEIERGFLEEAFKDVIADSFNCISVDGDMSTNDTAIIFANGLAENRLINKKDSSYKKFFSALKFVAEYLAKLIVKDGEGAKKFIEIFVENAKDSFDARKVARRIANSNLVKTMIAGGDPNWGRIAAACGSAGVEINANRLNIYLGQKDICVLRNGKATNADRKLLEDIFKKRDILIRIDLKMGKGSAKMWTCDLTEEYVRINAEYES